MKRDSLQRYRKRKMIEDVLIVIGPPILMLIVVLSFFKGDWIHTRLAKGLTSFVDSFFAVFTSMG